MKNLIIKVTVLLLCGLQSSGANAQTTITIRPDNSSGMDALISSFEPERNFGEQYDLLASAWTNGGTAFTARTLIDFNLSDIPTGAVIESAQLSLYGYESSSNAGHSTLNGSNEAIVSRVTSQWDGLQVTWNSQPSTTSEDQVVIPATTDPNQNVELDVSTLVQEMINYAEGSHGFMIQLVTEQKYRSMLFASSNHPDANLHPQLEITYVVPEPTNQLVVLRPNSDHGNDALISSFEPERNFGEQYDLLASAWTNGGTELTARTLIDFNLSDIPQGAVIESAQLSLYGYESSNNAGHSTLNGSNEAIVSRVTSQWDELQVTWNSQPTISSEHQVQIPATTDPNQNVDLDVSTLVQDMINDVEGSHGFMIQLVTEQKYRSMLFASSNHPDANLHPKLEITYSVPDDAEVIHLKVPNTFDVDIHTFTIIPFEGQAFEITPIESTPDYFLIDITTFGFNKFYIKFESENDTFYKTVLTNYYP